MYTLVRLVCSLLCSDVSQNGQVTVSTEELGGSCPLLDLGLSVEPALRAMIAVKA